MHSRTGSLKDRQGSYESIIENERREKAGRHAGTLWVHYRKRDRDETRKCTERTHRTIIEKREGKT